MNEQEIESMVVRLTGDGSSFQKMMTDAQQSSAQTAAFIQQHGKQIEDMSNQIKGFAGAATTALAALGAKNFLSNAFEMFKTSETQQLKLAAAIEANGRAAEPAIAAYKEFAGTMRDTMGASVNDTMSLLRKAESYGLVGEAAQRAASNSMAFAAVNDGEAESYLRVAAAMEKGDIQRAMQMSRMIPQLRGIRDQGEFMAKATALISTGTATAGTIMNSTEGVMKRYGNTIKALTKQFGEIVAEGVRPTIKWMTEFMQKFTNLDPVLKRVIVGVAFFAAGILSIGPVIGSVMAVVGPFMALFTSGWGLIVKMIPLILAPLGTLGAVIGSLTAIFGIFLIPLIAGIVAAGIAIAIFIDKSGGILPAWEKVKTYGAAAWAFVKEKTTAFVTWVTPYVNAGLANLGIAWRFVKGAAIVVWDYIQGRIEAFIAWASPTTGTFMDKISLLWMKISLYASLAWVMIKGYTLAFIDWAKPVFAAFVGFITSWWEAIGHFGVQVWDLVSESLSTFYDFAVDLFAETYSYWSEILTQITGGAQVSWSSVKDFIVDALIAGEFALRNFKQVWDWAIAGAALGLVTLAGQTQHFFTDVIPALLSYMRTNWMSVWRTVFDVVVLGFSTLSFGTLLDVIMGNLSFDQLRDRVARGFNDAMSNLPPLSIPSRTVSELENQLRREFEQQGRGLVESFTAFRDRRIAEIDAFEWPGLSPEQAAIARAQRAAAAAGDQVGSAYAAGAEKGVEKFDAALRWSAEALTRIAAYRDMLNRRTPGTAAALGGVAGAPVPGLPLPANIPPVPPVPAPGDCCERSLGVLRQMLAQLVRIADHYPATPGRPPTIVVAGERESDEDMLEALYNMPTVPNRPAPEVPLLPDQVVPVVEVIPTPLAADLEMLERDYQEIMDSWDEWRRDIQPVLAPAPLAELIPLFPVMDIPIEWDEVPPPPALPMPVVNLPADVGIPVILEQPQLPQVDVPDHSLYSMYRMPTVEIPTTLTQPEPLEVPQQTVTVVGTWAALVAPLVPSTVFTLADPPPVNVDVNLLYPAVNPPSLSASVDVLGTLIGQDEFEDDVGSMIGAIAPTVATVDVAPQVRRPVTVVGPWASLAASVLPNTVFTVPNVELPAMSVDLFPVINPPRSLADSTDVLGALLGDVDDVEDQVTAMLGSIAPTVASATIPAVQLEVGLPGPLAVDVLGSLLMPSLEVLQSAVASIPLNILPARSIEMLVNATAAEPVVEITAIAEPVVNVDMDNEELVDAVESIGLAIVKAIKGKPDINLGGSDFR